MGGGGGGSFTSVGTIFTDIYPSNSPVISTVVEL